MPNFDPITWLRQFRLGPFAIFDFTATYLVLYLLSPAIKWLFSLIQVNIRTAQIMWLALPLSIVAHIISKQDTALTKMFLDPNGHLEVKLLIVWMVFMALKPEKCTSSNSRLP